MENNESLKNIIVIIIKLVIFIGSVALVVIGQRNIGFQGLGTMMIGLVGILSLLYLYNKAHQ